jgi:hypothetical protein
MSRGGVARGRGGEGPAAADGVGGVAGGDVDDRHGARGVAVGVVGHIQGVGAIVDDGTIGAEAYRGGSGQVPAAGVVGAVAGGAVDHRDRVPAEALA